VSFLIILIIFAVSCFALRPSAAILEMLRCGVFLAMQQSGYMEPLLPALAVPTQVTALWGSHLAPANIQ